MKRITETYTVYVRESVAISLYVGAGSCLHYTESVGVKQRVVWISAGGKVDNWGTLVRELRNIVRFKLRLTSLEWTE